MKKMVNGQTIDIGDIRLFELAFEGLALNKLAVSNISTTIDKETDSIKNCIELYNRFYRSLPFPLYSIENNTKYAAIAEYIKFNIEKNKKVIKKKTDEQTDLKFWINNGIYILIEGHKALRLVGNTWGLVVVEKEEKDNAILDNFKSEVGYQEFKWALERLKEEKSIGGYYREFMPDFLRACGNNPIIIKRELNSILDFENVPSRITMDKNTIIDKDTNEIYNLDVYLKGKVANGKKITTFDLTSDDDSIYDVDQYIPAFGYDLYKKCMLTDKDLPDTIYYGKRVKVDDTKAYDSIFETLLKIGMLDGRVSNLKIRGFAKGRYIIYEVENRIFRCKNKEYCKSVEIAQGVDIYSIRGSKVFLLKEQNLKNKVIKEIIYSLDLETGDIKICRIGYK